MTKITALDGHAHNLTNRKQKYKRVLQKGQLQI